LSLLRRMLNVAVQESWLPRNPFSRGTSLISAADEVKRERIVTPEEEKRLLLLCTGKREHLRALIVCAIDTGMRWGEMTKLRAGDVDIESGSIFVEGTHTKTLRSRRLKMTPRVRAELAALVAGKRTGARIFQVGSVKRAWTGLRKDATLKDVRWHDLRHTNATRIERSGKMSPGQLEAWLGHTDPKTTARYVNPDDEAISEIAGVLEEFNLVN
jgi:integrase